MSTNEAGLIALVVDDELPALSDLGYLLERDERQARRFRDRGDMNDAQAVEVETAGVESGFERIVDHVAE